MVPIGVKSGKLDLTGSRLLAGLPSIETEIAKKKPTRNKSWGKLKMALKNAFSADKPIVLVSFPSDFSPLLFNS